MIENDIDSRVASEKSESAGAPEDEIEITPEMIKAGVDVLLLGWSGSEAEGVECIFDAMFMAMRKNRELEMSNISKVARRLEVLSDIENNA